MALRPESLWRIDPRKRCIRILRIRSLFSTHRPPSRFVVYQDQPAPITSSSNWDAFKAVTYLLKSLFQLLLTDVSELPLSAVAELDDRLKDSLDPMRAEMLRFTEDLRTLVAEKTITPELLTIEARNLIATRVEPVVRDAKSRTTEMMKSKFRKLFSSAAKAFGFTEAAFIDPRMISKAVQQTLETGALAFADLEEDRGEPMATATFVLKAQTLTPRC